MAERSFQAQNLIEIAVDTKDRM